MMRPRRSDFRCSGARLLLWHCWHFSPGRQKCPAGRPRHCYACSHRRDFTKTWVQDCDAPPAGRPRHCYACSHRRDFTKARLEDVGPGLRCSSIFKPGCRCNRAAARKAAREIAWPRSSRRSPFIYAFFPLLFYSFVDSLIRVSRQTPAVIRHKFINWRYQQRQTIIDGMKEIYSNSRSIDCMETSGRAQAQVVESSFRCMRLKKERKQQTPCKKSI